MARRTGRVILRLGLLGALAGAVAWLRGRRRASLSGGSPAGEAVWPPLADVAVAPGPEHSPVRVPGEGGTPPAAVDEEVPGPVAPPSAEGAWVLPVGGECPASHPVKAKVVSGIFHLPGMAFYARTSPDRCYVDAAAAEGDGLRRAKR
jgi:hypothetical protein